MLFLKRCWDWCVKHWKLLLVSIGGFIAFLIGYTRASRNTQRVKLELDLANKDKDLLEENNTKFHDAVVESVAADRYVLQIILAAVFHCLLK